MSEQSAAMPQQDLVVKRIVDAPLALVWRAWTEPEHVRRWWGPKDYVSPVCTLDLREGGQYCFAMRAPAEQGGQDSYTSGTYLKIVPLERLEFTQGLADAAGNRIEPAQLGFGADFPREFRTTVLFRAKGELTELVITQHGWPVGQMFVYALAGMQQSIDKLADSVAQA